MKRILVPTDFSSNAQDAFEYAIKFLNGQAAEIQILHVVRPVMVDTLDSAMINARATEIIVEQSQKNMDTLKAIQLNKDSAILADNITLKTKVSIGVAADEIVGQAKDFKADLIIMGTQGSNHTLVDKILGTVSTKLISTTPCPMILVPKDYKYKTIDNVVFSTNLDTGDPYELNRSLRYLESHTPLVRVIYVKSPYELDTETKIEAFAKYMVDHSPAIQTLFHAETSKDVEAPINEHALTHDAEMIIMHKSKKRLLDRLLQGSHTKKMVPQIYTPLMILN